MAWLILPGQIGMYNCFGLMNCLIAGCPTFTGKS